MHEPHMQIVRISAPDLALRLARDAGLPAAQGFDFNCAGSPLAIA